MKQIILHTSLVRQELMDWLNQIEFRTEQIDTWTIENHPAPDGSTFTLYGAVVIVGDLDVQKANDEPSRLT